MKKILFMVFGSVALGVFAAQNDTLITFSTMGPDYYKDGTTLVKDGECYALVWTKSGATFAGFLADGSLVDEENSKCIGFADVAENYRCPPTTFHLSPKLVAALGAGSFAVYLLDTRDVNGNVLGLAKDVSGKVTKVNAVNGYGAVKDADGAVVNITTGSTEANGSSVSTLSSSAATAAQVQNNTELPGDLPGEIKAIHIENGKVKITVANSARYAQYNLNQGLTPDAIIDNPVADKAIQGDDTGDIELEYEIKNDAKSGFFRLRRNN